MAKSPRKTKNSKLKWNHKLPTISGRIIIVDRNKLTEALELMWTNQITPEEVDQYLVADLN